MHIFSTAFSGVLETLIGFTGDWFIAIALTTVAIKLALFPLAVVQQRALLLSQNLNEVRTILSKKFKDRSEIINNSIIKIMTKYKVNPLLPFITLIIQAPVFFSLYFSLLNLSTTVGSSLAPWILSVSRPDSFHILPVTAGLFQGLTGFISTENRNILMFALPLILGLFFLWKAPAALSVYWGISSLLSFIEKKIMSLKSFQQRYLTVASAEEMIKSIG